MTSQREANRRIAAGWKSLLLYVSAAAILFLAASGRPARAQSGCDDDCIGPVAPEIDPSLAAGGLALTGGVVLLLRSRMRPR